MLDYLDEIKTLPKGMTVSDEDISRLAWPEESHHQARARIEGEMAARFGELQGCLQCIKGATTRAEAEENHNGVGHGFTCSGPGNPRTEIAANPHLYKAVMGQQRRTLEVLAQVAKNAVAKQIAAIPKPEDYHTKDADGELAAMLKHVEVFGYIRALEDMGLLSDEHGQLAFKAKQESAEKIVSLHDQLAVGTLSTACVMPLRHVQPSESQE